MTPTLSILLLLLGGQAGGKSQSPETRLAAALSCFDSAVAKKSHSGPEAQRLYRQALAGFVSLLEEGVQSSALHYNIANTYLRLGDVGRAIVHYRRALRLEPDNEKVRKNLEVARKMCEVRIEKPATSAMLETLLFWHFGTSTASRMRVGLAAYVVFWTVMLASLLAARRIPALTWTAIVLAAVSLACGVSVGWDRVSTTNRIEGVLTADKVVLRKGNGDYYDPQFERPLPPGVEFRVMETRLDVQGAAWYHVELPDGKEGWVRADQTDVI